MNQFAEKEPYILSPDLKYLREKFDELRRHKKDFNTANCMMITGESGSGKSELAKRYLQIYPSYQDQTGTKQPILHLEIKMANTVKDVLVSLLVGINDPQMGNGARNSSELFTRFVRLSKVIELELIILDEVQVIIERRSEKVISGIGDLFKDLIKETGIPIVFMGMPWARYLIDSNPQLNGRIAIRHTMPIFKVSEQKKFEDFASLVKGLTKSYGLSNAIDTSNKELLLRLFAFSKGNVRQISRLLRSLFIFCTINSKQPNSRLLADIVESLGYPEAINPFKQNITDVVIEENLTESDFLFSHRSKGNSIIAPEIARFRITKDLKIYSIV
uniref:Uncharacterized protein n=1 Tax=Hydrogenovibrio crunogenus (strain DSM 25203 / XCL-2) TaxID=317025 RepID=Q31IQ1_HYDCU